MPAEFQYNLTKKLTSHLSHKLCAALPKSRNVEQNVTRSIAQMAKYSEWE